MEYRNYFHTHRLLYAMTQVYLLKSFQTAEIKIGTSVNVERRIQGLADVPDLTLSRVLTFNSTDDAKKYERQLHSEFSAYRNPRAVGGGRTEWFDAAIYDSLLQTAERIVRESGCDLLTIEEASGRQFESWNDWRGRNRQFDYRKADNAGALSKLERYVSMACEHVPSQIGEEDGTLQLVAYLPRSYDEKLARRRRLAETRKCFDEVVTSEYWINHGEFSRHKLAIERNERGESCSGAHYDGQKQGEFLVLHVNPIVAHGSGLDFLHRQRMKAAIQRFQLNAQCHGFAPQPVRPVQPSMPLKVRRSHLKLV